MGEWGISLPFPDSPFLVLPHSPHIVWGLAAWLHVLLGVALAGVGFTAKPSTRAAAG